MSFRAVLRLYNALLPLALVLSAPASISKMLRRGQAGRNLEHRFGRYGAALRARLIESQPPIWIHAVSVGEVLLALKLIHALRDQAPSIPIVLSCTTSTGFRLAEERAGDDFTLLYNPLDLPFAVRRAFDTLRPRALILIESEIWPNLLEATRRRDVPVLLANARLSPRSENRYARFAKLTRPIFERLDGVLVTAQEDIDRWAGLGVERDRIHLTGSIKFDQSAPPTSAQQLQTLRAILDRACGNAKGPVLLAGSTHPGEEKLLGDAFLRLRDQHPDAFFIAVPRHFERAGDVVRDLASLGFEPLRRTQIDPSAPSAAPAASLATDRPACLVVDTTGELRGWYELATLVFVGKTFLANEGQNPIEPLLAGKPIVTGPAMKNFGPLFDRLHASGGVLRLPLEAALDPATIAQETHHLLTDPTRQRQIVEAGQAIVAPDQGAANRTATQILQELSRNEE